MSQLPKTLYRGDCDSTRARQLHATWTRDCIITNLANGGSGKAIFNAPLIDSVKKHVGVGWDKTHFLSFSESYERAKDFAAGDPPRTIDQVPDDSHEWDSLVFWTNTSVFQNVREVEPAIYTASYPGYQPTTVGHQHDLMGALARSFEVAGRVGDPVKVLLVDVVKFLDAKVKAGDRSVLRALTYAENDQEWLLLPTDPFFGNHGEHTGEFSAKLDKGFLHGCHKFKFVE